MKKLMICSIILMPLIILLTLFVSTAVISAATYVYVSEVQFVEDTVYLQKVDDEDVSETLKVNVLPLKADNKDVEFWSDDTDIVKIDQNGVVTSVDFGTAYVRVRSKENPSLVAACKVVVWDDKIHRLNIENFPESLAFGESARLTCSYAPTGVSNIGLKYQSDNTDLATVSADGTVTANRVNGGYVTIKVWSEGNPAAYAEVKVKIYGIIQSINFSNNADVLAAEKSFDLPEVSVYPESAAWGNELTYSISDESVAKIENGKIVFSRYGKVTLTVSDEYGHEIKKDYESTWGHYDSVAFNGSSTEITVNYEDYITNALIEFEYSAKPKNATEPIVLGSTNQSVIAVENGKFYVRGGGKTVVSMSIVKCTGETVNTNLTVTVKRRSTAIEFSDASIEGRVTHVVTLNGRYQIKTTISPSDSSDNVTYEVKSGSEYARVDSRGLVTFFGESTAEKIATVRATTTSGVSAEIVVTYLCQSANPVEIKDDEPLSFVMPDSGTTQEVCFSAYSALASCGEIYYVIERVDDGATVDNGATVEGTLIKITKPGTYTISAIRRERESSYSLLIDDVVIASTTITVTREVEGIIADLIEVWSDIDTKTTEWTSSRQEIYTSAKIIRIENIAFSPVETTKSAPDSVTISGENVATLNTEDGYKVVFNRVGEIVLTIKVDGVELKATIKSTFGLLDNTAKVDVTENKSVCLNDGSSNNTFTIDNFISIIKVSPDKAQISDAKIVVLSGSAILSDDKKRIEFNSVGRVEFYISYTTAHGGVNTNAIIVTVTQNPESVKLTQGSFVVSDNVVDLKALYSVFPEKATVTDTSYALASECGYASITSDGKLKFSAAGRVEVIITVNKKISNKVVVVYYGEYSCLDGGYVEVGTSFVVNVSSVEGLDADSKFECNNSYATITNGVIITVESKGEFKITIGKNEYAFEGVVKAIGVTIGLDGNKDECQAHLLSDGTYLTGLKEVRLTASVLGKEEVSYASVAYSVDNEDIATVDIEGKVTFIKAGKIIVGATEKFGKSASITIESTFGSLTKISANTTLTLDYDTDGLEVGYDFSGYFAGYPSQISLNNVQLKVSDVDVGVTATVVDGKKVKLSARSDFTLTCCQDDKVYASIAVKVNRSVSDIIVTVDGKDVEEYSVTIDKSFADVGVKYLPSDANYGFGVEAIFDDDSQEVADISKHGNLNVWRLTFSCVNKQVLVCFNFLTGSKKISFEMTSFSRTVYFDSETIVVGKGELFTFSEYGLSLSDLVLDGQSDDTFESVASNYRINKSGKFTLSGKNGGNEFTKDIIVTSRFVGFADVELTDVDHDGNFTDVAVLENQTHVTASKSIKVGFSGVGDAINVDGYEPLFIYESSNDDIATVSEKGEVVFKKSGRVTISIEIKGKDIGGEYICKYSFIAYSSFGRVDDFGLTGENETKNFVIDEICEYSLVCAPTVPQKYGVFTASYSYESNDESVAKVIGDKVVFLKSGTATITVSTEKGDGSIVKKAITFKVDKLIDTIAVVDNEDEAKTRSQVVVNSSSYQIKTIIGSNSPVAPTLNSLKFSIKDCKSGCTVDQNGLVSFASGVTGKFIVLIEADRGSAKYELPIVKVASGVQIIKFSEDSSVDMLVLQKGKTYAVDAAYGAKLPAVTISDDLGNVDELGVFTPTKGVESNIEIAYLVDTKEIKVIVEENVEDISLKNGYSESIRDAIYVFDLTQLFDAKITPSTAGRAVDGLFVNYEVEYSVDDGSIAEITKNEREEYILTFVKEGKVVVTFSANGVSKSVFIESTFGYADVISFNDNSRTFAYTDGSYAFNAEDYTVTPSNAEASKYALSVKSSNTKVATVDGLTINFVGGGETVLTFEYKKSSTVTLTTLVTVKVIKRADGLTVSYDGRETQNVVTSANSVSLTANVLGENLSAYDVEYVSSDESVMTVDNNGKVTILQTGDECTITVKVISRYDGVVAASRDVTVRRAPYSLINVNAGTDLREFVLGGSNNYSLHFAESTLSSSFAVTSASGAPIDSEVVSVNEKGDLTILSVGSAYITATDKDGESKTFEIRVYKVAEGINFNPALDRFKIGDEYVTSGEELQLFAVNPYAAIYPSDADFGKTVEFSYDTSIATIDESGNVSFSTTDDLVVTVTVKRSGVVECSDVIKLRSTLGCAIEATLYNEGAVASASYTFDYYGAGNSKNKTLVFNVDDFKPADLILTTSNFTASANIGGVISVSVDVDSKEIAVTATGKGECALTISVARLTFRIDFTVLRKVEKVVIYHDSVSVTSLNVLDNKFTLRAEALPDIANNREVEWILPAGVANDNGKFTITGDYGTYEIKAKAKDGSGCYATVSVEYLESITGFKLKFDDELVDSDSYTQYLAYNENSFTFDICPTPDGLKSVKLGDFDVVSKEGYTYSINYDYTAFKLSLKLPTDADKHFEDVITIYYLGEKYPFTFNVYRSGVESITFKYYNKSASNPSSEELTNTLDTQYGYQQMRVFGNKSYYGGPVDYYKMYVEVSPSNDYLKYVDFTANNGVTVTKDSSYDFVYVNFNGCKVSSLNAILEDDFSDGVATVSATDVGGKLGSSACSYDFHVVEGVNVFDSAGYLNGGSTVVLHVNLGHDDEETSNLPNRVKFDGYATSANRAVVNKTTIYGNGYLINFANKNNYNEKTSWGSTYPIAEDTSYGYTAIKITNAINVKLKGTNDTVNGDTSRKYYFIELSSVSNVYYCEAYNMYRVIESYNNNVYVKRSLFRTCASSGVIASAKDSAADGESGFKLEDIIMFDTGSRAIETHANPIYVKGFLDVYNFQNKSALKEAIGTTIISNEVFNQIKNDNADVIENANGEDWFNMVGLSTKGYFDMYYYTEGYTENSGYKKITTSEHAENGLKKIEISYDMKVYEYKLSIWSYPNTSDYIRWGDQFKENGELDNSKMMSTVWKIKRLGKESVTEG